MSRCEFAAAFVVTFLTTGAVYRFCRRHTTDRRGFTCWPDNVARIERITS